MLLLLVHLLVTADPRIAATKVRTRILARKHAVHDRLLHPLRTIGASQTHL